jgi:protein-L-isoaspartate(D-aspartate) O-methyltransferase
MTDLAEPQPGDRVLDVGTGSGYQAAVLAELGCQVYSIERLQGLLDRAADNLASAGYDAVRLRCGDGLQGWPEAAPFDAILVAAAWPGEAPVALVEQLRAPGRLVIPLARKGPFGEQQVLTRVDKGLDGEVTEQGLLPVAFVPLIGESKA